MHMRMPEKEIAEGLDRDDQARLPARASGAVAEPGGDGVAGGQREFAEPAVVGAEASADEPGHRENEMAMGHVCAHLLGDEGGLDERAPLMA